MECICSNYFNELQNQIRNLLSTYINNNINSQLPRTSDGDEYQPNLNLVSRERFSFDTNIFFYVCMILLAIASLSSIIRSRRRIRLGGNRSSLN